MSRRAGAIAVAFIAVAVFWRTAFPEIDWWDSADYSLAAATLGVTGAPGSLVMVLLGWPIVHLLPGDSPAHRLNLFAGLLGGLAAVLVYVVAFAMRTAAGDEQRDSRVTVIAAASGALAFAFGRTSWEYSVMFTPYIMTAVFTGLILWTLVRWWRDADEPDSWRLLALAGVLFGLDFSVHRTNGLLIPAAIVWVILRKPAALGQWRNWAGGAVGLITALALQLLWIPIGYVSKSPLFWTAPRNLHEFWSYISMEDRGGGFLLDVITRKSPFWSSQAADLWRVFSASYLGWSIAFGIAGLIGIVALWRRNRRLGAAFTALFFIQAALTVIYFNIPANYFRSLDRHYMPVLVTFGVAVAIGLMEIARFAEARRGATVVAALCVVVAGGQVARNFRDSDASNRHFAADYARNILGALPSNAIHFTVGDNDTFPLMYMQAVEGVRRDVQVINYSVASMAETPERMRRLYPDLPMRGTTAERKALMKKLPEDTSFVVVAQGDAVASPSGVAMPASVALRASSFNGQGPMNLTDLSVVDVLSTNQWRRPVTFSVTAGNLQWLTPYARPEGLYWRILPVVNPPADIGKLRQLTDLEYRGYANPSVPITGATINIGFLYYSMARDLLARESKIDPARCQAEARRLREVMPIERLPFKTEPWGCPSS
jgi:hypothetical protein